MVAPFLRPDGDLSPAEQRAAISALAGAQRIPFGRTRQFTLTVAAAGIIGTQVASNGTPSALLFIEVRAIATEPAISFNASMSPTMSALSSPQYAFPAESPTQFLLYPGESLFLGAASGGPSAITVSEVRV